MQHQHPRALTSSRSPAPDERAPDRPASPAPAPRSRTARASHRRSHVEMTIFLSGQPIRCVHRLRVPVIQALVMLHQVELVAPHRPGAPATHRRRLPRASPRQRRPPAARSPSSDATHVIRGRKAVHPVRPDAPQIPRPRPPRTIPPAPSVTAVPAPTSRSASSDRARARDARCGAANVIFTVTAGDAGVGSLAPGAPSWRAVVAVASAGLASEPPTVRRAAPQPSGMGPE